jgi:transmembrane sensor
MDKKDIRQVIDNYFHDKINEKEIEKALKELSNVKNVAEIEELMAKHWEESEKKQIHKNPDFNSLLYKIHHRINLTKQDHKISSPGTEGILRKKATLKLIAENISRIAAILFLPLLLTFAYYLFYKTKEIRTEPRIVFNEVYTPLSAKTKLVLPDGTIVWLNSGSRLKYPSDFSGKSRDVYLSGEGYFKVTSNKEVPFVVKTNELNIIAYGTSFNVMAYSDDRKIETTLVEGRIKVEESHTKSSMYLKPSDRSVFFKGDNKQKIDKVDTQFYTSWKEGKLIFRNEPIDEVIHKLDRWFNCTIILENEALKNYRYTGNIEMETLREVIDLIGITTPIKYTYNKETREIRIKSK